MFGFEGHVIITLNGQEWLLSKLDPLASFARIDYREEEGMQSQKLNNWIQGLTRVHTVQDVPKRKGFEGCALDVRGGNRKKPS